MFSKRCQYTRCRHKFVNIQSTQKVSCSVKGVSIRGADICTQIRGFSFSKECRHKFVNIQSTQKVSCSVKGVSIRGADICTQIRGFSFSKALAGLLGVDTSISLDKFITRYQCNQGKFKCNLQNSICWVYGLVLLAVYQWLK